MEDVKSAFVLHKLSDEEEEEEEEEESPFDEDLESFNNTCKAMETMGIMAEDQTRVWRTVGVVLCLGEVEFELNADHEDKDNLQRSRVRAGLERVSSLVGIPEKQLEYTLCHRSVRAGKRGSISYVPLSPERAKESCDALGEGLRDWFKERE